jgi:cellobiose phosphorylase
MEELAAYKKDDEYQAFATEHKKALEEVINKYCWDEDRFTRGFTEAGERIGERKAPEANMWLNPQSWAVISGLATKEQADSAMNLVHERLNSAYGAVLMDPPYHSHAFDGALGVIYNQGTKENAGIFSQTQGWLILAEALLGNGDRAYEYYRENSPAAQNDRAETRHLEPYCYGQFTEGPASPHFGRSHVHWLTGTASTIMVGSVEGILGMRPDLEGIRIAPSIPSDWDGLKIEKTFRGSRLHITVKNPDHAQSGCKSLTLNGKLMEGNYIPASELKEENEIELVM